MKKNTILIVFLAAIIPLNSIYSSDNATMDRFWLLYYENSLNTLRLLKQIRVPSDFNQFLPNLTKAYREFALRIKNIAPQKENAKIYFNRLMYHIQNNTSFGTRYKNSMTAIQNECDRIRRMEGGKEFINRYFPTPQESYNNYRR